jgi:hypothetical protein
MDDVDKLGDIAAASGLRRISILAWRDLADPEAGGSEIHMSNVAALWVRAGLDVTMRTSYAPGKPQVSWRDGYRVVRKAGRYTVFPRAAFSEVGTATTTRWWRSGTACRSSRRCGPAVPRSRGCTTCTTRCGR